MESFTFTGLGTHWSVMVEDGDLQEKEKREILQYIKEFERRFSRFLPYSEVSTFRSAVAGEYAVSEEFTRLISVAEKLRVLTDGAYDPAAGGLLECAGYGLQHQADSSSIQGFTLPRWSFNGNQLTIDGPITFDFGGIGKGYCIDQVAKMLEDFGYREYVVDGGGDMVATTKANGAPWRIAIEYPGRPDSAASIVSLRHRGLAVSDSFRRRFGKGHHLMNAQTKQSVESIIGCAAVAKDAWSADCMTSGLFFADPCRYALLAKEFKASYLVFQSDGTVRVSSDWQGELF